MNLGQLADAVAERVGALPHVARTYPPKRSLVTALLPHTDAVSPVLAERDGPNTSITIAVGIDGSATAAGVSGAISDAVHDVLDAAADGSRQVIVRIASIDD